MECLGPYGPCHPGNNCKSSAKTPGTLNAHSHTIYHDYVRQATRVFSVTEAFASASAPASADEFEPATFTHLRALSLKLFFDLALSIV